MWRGFFRLRYGRRVEWGAGVLVNHKFRFRGPGRLQIGAGSNLWAHAEPNQFLTFAPDAVISVGPRCRLNGVMVQCKTAVSFGADSLVGSCHLLDYDFHSVHFRQRHDPAAARSAPIKVGPRVWLAGQSAVLKGVTIGAEAVVGFRAVVTGDVAAKNIVAGNPARVVKVLP